MSVYLAIAIYLVCWWIVLFTILPLRIGSQLPENEPDPFADAVGAPRSPNMGLKFVVTTVVSAVIFGVIYVALAYRLVTLDAF